MQRKLVDASAHSAISFKGTACAPKCLPTSLFYFNIVQFFTSRCRCSWTNFRKPFFKPKLKFSNFSKWTFSIKTKIPIFRKPPVLLIIDSETSQAYSSMQLSDKNENELLPLSDNSHSYLCTGHFHLGLQWHKFEDSFKVKSTKRIYNKKL